MVACIYLLAKEYTMLPVTDQETLKMAFAVVTPAGNSLVLYIDPIIENPPIMVRARLSMNYMRQSLRKISMKAVRPT